MKLSHLPPLQKDYLFKDIKYELFIPKLYALRRRRLSPNTYRGSKNFFIFGSGRNGSTMLAKLLNNSRELFLPPEQYVLPYSIIYWHLLRGNSRDFVRRYAREYGRKNQNWKLSKFSFDEIITELQDIPEISPSYLFYRIVSKYAAEYKEAPRLYGDHSPITTHFHKFVRNAFPQSKVIFLIRHPFDVMLSYKKIKNHRAAKSKYALYRWNRSIEAYDGLIRDRKEVLLVSYENLVSDVDSEMQRVFDFLQVSDEGRRPHPKDIKVDLGTGNLTYHKNIEAPVNNGFKNNWIHKISPLELEQFAPIVSKNAERFGYSLEMDASSS